MKKVFLSLLILSLFSCSSTQTGDGPGPGKQNFYKYIGVYSSNANEDYKVIIQERGGKLYIKDFRGKDEITFKSDSEFRLKNLPVEGEFSKVKNGRYQYFSMRENGVIISLTRAIIPAAENNKAVYDSNDNIARIEENINNEDRYEIITGTISEVEGDTELVNDLIQKINNGYFGNQNSLLVMKDGQLVVEQYFRGWSRDESYLVQSISKSYTSLLLGDAIAQGYIESVDDCISKYLPDYKTVLSGEKDMITIKDLLTMSAGLSWDEWAVPYTDNNNIRNRELSSDDSIEFVLSTPIINKPGEVFTYSGGYVTVIGEIIKNATESASLADFAGKSSFAKLNMKNAYWYEQHDSRQNAAGGLLLRPIDMAKIGQLVLDKGKWEDRQIIDRSWIEESTETQISTNDNNWAGYGYCWWIGKFKINDKMFKAIAALGWGGQRIIIIEDLNLVVVITADNYGRRTYDHDIITRFIIPAFI